MAVETGLLASVVLSTFPNPKLVLASAAVVAPVPPLVMAISVPFQVPEDIVPRVHPLVPSCCARIFPLPSAKITLLDNVGDKPKIFDPIIVLLLPVVIPIPTG